MGRLGARQPGAKGSVMNAKPLFVAAYQVAVCRECGNVHLVGLNSEDRQIAGGALDPSEAIVLAEALVEAVIELRSRAAGGDAKCH